MIEAVCFFHVHEKGKQLQSPNVHSPAKEFGNGKPRLSCGACLAGWQACSAPIALGAWRGAQKGLGRAELFLLGAPDTGRSYGQRPLNKRVLQILGVAMPT